MPALNFQIAALWAWVGNDDAPDDFDFHAFLSLPPDNVKRRIGASSVRFDNRRCRTNVSLQDVILSGGGALRVEIMIGPKGVPDPEWVRQTYEIPVDFMKFAPPRPNWMHARHES